MNKKHYITVAISALIIGSCVTKKNNVNNETSATKKAEVSICNNFKSYASIDTIISKNCNGCHKSGKKIPDFTDFATLKKHVDNGEIYKTVIELRSMPPKHKLSDSQLIKINCWIQQGGNQ